MNKFIKSLAVLATVGALASPAAAQISGFVSVDGLNFGARIGLNYAAEINPSTTLVAGLRYNLFISPSSPSAATAFVGADAILSDTLLVGGRIFLSLSDIGVSNSVGVTIRPFISYLIIGNGDLGVSATLSLNTPVLPAFQLQPWLAIDGSYLSGPLGVDFGVEADFSVVPAFSFDGVFGYLHIGYEITPALNVFGGAALAFAGGTFGLTGGLYGPDYRGLYAGLNFAINQNFGVRLVGGYDSNIFFTLTGSFRL
jgi:hypothetical protein